jgi:hypothetical protein
LQLNLLNELFSLRIGERIFTLEFNADNADFCFLYRRGRRGSAVSTRLRLGKQQMRRTQIREQNQNAKPQADPASHGLKLYAKP